MRMRNPVAQFKYLFVIVFAASCFAASAQQQTSDQLAESANTSYEAGDPAQAIKLCTKAITLNPSNARAYNVRGLAYTKANMLAFASMDFNKAIELVPNYGSAYVNRGLLNLKIGSPSEALADYDMALSVEPKSTWALLNRGNFYYDKKEYSAAIEDYNGMLAISTSYADGYAKRGNAYYALGNFTNAEADYARARALGKKVEVPAKKADVTSKRNDVATKKTEADYLTSGNAHYSAKEYDLAIADYTSALSINPKYILAISNRALCYDAQGYMDKAIAEYSETLRLSPGNPFASVQRGLLYYRKSSFDKALEDFSKTLLQEPANVDALTFRGYCYISKMKYDAAQKDFDAALKADPKYAEAYAGSGTVSFFKDKYAEAISYLTQSLKLYPQNAFAYRYRALSYDRLGKPDLATADYNEAIRMDPTRDAYLNRASYYYFKGKPELAIPDYVRAIEIDPNYAYAYRARAAAYNLRGEYSKAIPDYMQALRAEPEEADNYLDFFTTCLHTGDINSAKTYYRIYKEKNLHHKEDSQNWKFYGHYITALTEGVLSGSYDLALKELKLAEQTYSTDNSSSQKKDDTRYGFVDILFLQGYVFEKLERFEEARVSYEQALVINDNQPDIKVALGRLDSKKAIAITVDKTPPTIEIISPQTTRSFDIVSDQGETQVIGRAKDANGIKSVTINGKAVQRLEEDGLFIQDMPLDEGDNVLNVEVLDKNDNKATQSFTVKANIKKVAENVNANANDALLTGKMPVYHAIFIAEQDYQDKNIPDLANPIKDAKELMEILKTSYNFDPKNIDTLFNASRQNIFQALMQKKSVLKEDDNLLIFYAGHGWGTKNKFGDTEGYWIPSTAKKDDILESYISADQIKTALQSNSSKHILIIADACYSGSFTRAVLSNASQSIQRQFNVPSRKIMTSGNMELVPDNSRMMYYLIQNLKENKDKYLTAERLFDSIKDPIRNNSKNDPQYAAISDIGDEGGQFVFIKK